VASPLKCLASSGSRDSAAVSASRPDGPARSPPHAAAGAIVCPFLVRGILDAVGAPRLASGRSRLTGEVWLRRGLAHLSGRGPRTPSSSKAATCEMPRPAMNGRSPETTAGYASVTVADRCPRRRRDQDHERITGRPYSERRLGPDHTDAAVCASTKIACGCDQRRECVIACGGEGGQPERRSSLDSYRGGGRDVGPRESGPAIVFAPVARFVADG
jgi:hypothetical protein